MKRASKILGILLITTFLVTAQATGVLLAGNHAGVALAEMGEHSADCQTHHGASLIDSQRRRSPPPTPVSYQCCLTGHGTAAVRTSYSAEPAAECARISAQIETALPPCWVSGLEVSTVLSADPPSSAPLRI